MRKRLYLVGLSHIHVRICIAMHVSENAKNVKEPRRWEEVCGVKNIYI